MSSPSTASQSSTARKSTWTQRFLPNAATILATGAVLYGISSLPTAHASRINAQTESDSNFLGSLSQGYHTLQSSLLGMTCAASNWLAPRQTHIEVCARGTLVGDNVDKHPSGISSVVTIPRGQATSDFLYVTAVPAKDATPAEGGVVGRGQICTAWHEGSTPSKNSTVHIPRWFEDTSSAIVGTCTDFRDLPTSLRSWWHGKAEAAPNTGRITCSRGAFFPLEKMVAWARAYGDVVERMNEEGRSWNGKGSAPGNAPTALCVTDARCWPTASGSGLVT